MANLLKVKCLFIEYSLIKIPFIQHVFVEYSHINSTLIRNSCGPVTKIENIKTDATKILRPTHFGE
jgi:hypothetical protein